MTATTGMLDEVKIATPCTARWEDMTGDERVRRCGLCRLDVYNVAEMSRGDAEKLLRDATGRTCMRIYRREDGTVITRDCPTALRALRRKVAWAAAALLAAGVTVAAMLTPRGARGVTSVTPVKQIVEFIDRQIGPPPPPPAPIATLGEACVPAPTPPALPTPREPVMGDVAIPRK